MVTAVAPLRTFTYDYHWVNDGRWMSSSREDDAISKAKIEAMKQGMNYHNYKMIVIERISCQEPEEHIDICYSFRVTLIAEIN